MKRHRSSTETVIHLLRKYRALSARDSSFMDGQNEYINFIKRTTFEITIVIDGTKPLLKKSDPSIHFLRIPVHHHGLFHY